MVVESSSSDSRYLFTIGQCATLACQLEATAPKPGNVHRGADFEDLVFFDFLASAVAIVHAVEAVHEGAPVGESILAAVRSTREVTGTNTNLGTILLIMPLAAVERDTPLASGIESVLKNLNFSDSHHMYEAIRMAQPSGMGTTEQLDIKGDAPEDVLDAMRLVKDSDAVAKQYVTDFAEVLDCVVPWLVQEVGEELTLTSRIIHTHVKLLAKNSDSLIARKCGSEIAAAVACRAAKVLEAGPPQSEPYLDALSELDFWLRADGHRRNPGTTADLIAAGLFCGLRDGIIRPPLR